MFDFLKKKPEMVLHDYRSSDGSFDYDRYKGIQEDGNLQKIGNVGVLEGNIQFLAEYLLRRMQRVDFGICHGTRRGLEQSWFRKYLPGSNVIGTEIASSASDFDHTVQWDFHEDNPEWIGEADFVFSNSLDHAYDPKKAFSSWMRSLKPGGVCIIEHNRWHNPEYADELDPFGVTRKKLKELIPTWGAFEIIGEKEGPAFKRKKLKVHFLFAANIGDQSSP